MGKHRRLGFATRFAIGCGIGVVAAACGLEVVGTRRENAVIPPGEAGLDADPLPDGPLPESDAEAGIDAGPCGYVRGPKMVLGPDSGVGVDGGFCIDTTEVTNAQYDEFLLATGGGRIDAGVPEGGLPNDCALLATFSRVAPSGGPNQPVAWVPWCSALAYCRWAGKRLCNGTFNVDTTGEWYAACSLNGTRLYPYGNAYEAGSCNDTSGTTEPVGTRTSCEGGLPGVVDMAGNVQEFLQACVPSSCMGVGGGPIGGSAASCRAGAFYEPVLSANANTGFRCCADLR